MKQIIRLLLVLLLTLSLASLAFAQESISVGDSVEGEADGDTVEYEIELEEGQEVVITLEAEFDTVVLVLDEDGDELDSNDDGPGMGLNSLLEFEADDDATYTIVVDAFGGSPDGEFELSVEDADAEEADDEDEDSEPTGDADMGYDSEVEFDVDGEDELEVTFEGSEGDVITILVTSEADQTFDLSLEDPDGDLVREDNFNFDNASLVRIELEDDGLYTIIVIESDEEELEDEYEIEILEEEALDLGEGPQTSAELNDDRDQDYMFFEAEEDVVYLVGVELDGDLDTSVTIELCEGDFEDCFFGDVRVTLAGTEQAIFLFEASDDGLVNVSLDYFSFSNEMEVTITVEEQ